MKCAWEECEREAEHRGFCNIHYRQALKYGKIQRLPKVDRRCKVDGCEKKVVAYGYCMRHDAQIRIHGKIFGNPLRTIRDPNEIEVTGDTAKMKLYNRQSYEVAETVFDASDVPKIAGKKWHCDALNYVVMDEYNPRRKIPFARELMQCGDKRLHVDHIDGDSLNNRKSNLRICTAKNNHRNKHKSHIGESKYKGVSLTGNAKNPYRAKIRINSKGLHLGVFNDELVAAKAYNDAALKHFGEFAHLNEV